jgi:hypothetical protein
MVHDPTTEVGARPKANRRIKTPRALAGAAATSGKRQSTPWVEPLRNN